jgi:abhydrolase domain-containing protein 12
VLPYADYLSSRKHGVGSVLPLEVYCDALRSRRTLLYAHGNAGNRATGHRQRIARFVSHMDVNFVTFDYRGFGDSSKHITASEAGLVADARAMWDWLRGAAAVLCTVRQLSGVRPGC